MDSLDKIVCKLIVNGTNYSTVEDPNGVQYRIPSIYTHFDHYENVRTLNQVEYVWVYRYKLVNVEV